MRGIVGEGSYFQEMLDLERQDLRRGGGGAPVKRSRSRMADGRLLHEDVCYRLHDPKSGLLHLDPCERGKRPRKPREMDVMRTINLHSCHLEGLLHELGHLHNLGHSGVGVWSELGASLASEPMRDPTTPEMELPDPGYFDLSSIMSVALLPQQEDQAVQAPSYIYRGFSGFQLFRLGLLGVDNVPIPNIHNSTQVSLYSVSSRRNPLTARVGIRARASLDFSDDQVLWIEWRERVGLDRDLTPQLCRALPTGSLVNSLLIRRAIKDGEQQAASELLAIGLFSSFPPLSMSFTHFFFRSRPHW